MKNTCIDYTAKIMQKSIRYMPGLIFTWKYIFLRSEELLFFKHYVNYANFHTIMFFLYANIFFNTFFLSICQHLL